MHCPYVDILLEILRISSLHIDQLTKINVMTTNGLIGPIDTLENESKCRFSKFVRVLPYGANFLDA